MDEHEKKTETEVTPEGAVEVNEEDLEQASGGAGYLKIPTDQLKLSTTDQLKVNPSDPSLKLSKGEFGLKRSYDL